MIDRHSVRKWRWSTVGVLLAALPVYGDDLQVVPSASLSEIYSSNITLAPRGEEQDDLITEVAPGVHVDDEGERLHLNLDYQLEDLLYANESDADDIRNQLQASGTMELLRGIFYVDANTAYYQEVINPDQPISLDNIDIGNRTNVESYSISPYFRFHLGSEADVELRYQTGYVYYDEGASDGTNQAYLGKITNGNGSGRLQYTLNYDRSQLDLSNGDFQHLESDTANILYRISSTLGFLVHAGYENNAILPIIQVLNNGYYWSAGAQWTPTREILMSATTGYNNWDASLDLYPNVRTTFQLDYQNSKVGLLTGSNWSMKFNHFSRLSHWNASYTEQVTSVQALQLAGLIPVVELGPGGNLILDPKTGLPEVQFLGVFALTDQEFLAKISQFGYGIQTEKSQLGVTLFKQTREYQLVGGTATAWGATGAWSWRVMPRTRSQLEIDWESYEDLGSDLPNRFWDIDIELMHDVSAKTSVGVGYRYTQDDVPLGGLGYFEQRLWIWLRTGL